MLQPQEEQIIIALRQITQAIDAYSRLLLQKHGLTAPQIATLRELSEVCDSTPGKLADELHLSPQTMAGILNRLEQRQLIERHKHDGDRRVIRVRITDAGCQAIAQAPPLLRDRFRSELARLAAWEQTQILATLQRVAAMMHADELTVSPFLDHSVSSNQPAAGCVQEVML